MGKTLFVVPLLPVLFVLPLSAQTDWAKVATEWASDESWCGAVDNYAQLFDEAQLFLHRLGLPEHWEVNPHQTVFATACGTRRALTRQKETAIAALQAGLSELRDVHVATQTVALEAEAAQRLLDTLTRVPDAAFGRAVADQLAHDFRSLSSEYRLVQEGAAQMLADEARALRSAYSALREAAANQDAQLLAEAKDSLDVSVAGFVQQARAAKERHDLSEAKLLVLLDTAQQAGRSLGRSVDKAAVASLAGLRSAPVPLGELVEVQDLLQVFAHGLGDVLDRMVSRSSAYRSLQYGLKSVEAMIPAHAPEVKTLQVTVRDLEPVLAVLRGVGWELSRFVATEPAADVMWGTGGERKMSRAEAAPKLGA